MEGFERYQRANIPVPKCAEMQAVCTENANRAVRERPEAERQYARACQDVIDWVKSMGPLELEKREQRKVRCAENLTRLASDKRHWLERAQAWRNCMRIHPEIGQAEVGAKCSHGHIAPMCAIDAPVLKVVEREPGEDDE